MQIDYYSCKLSQNGTIATSNDQLHATLDAILVYVRMHL